MADQSSSPRGLPPTLWAVLLVTLAGAFAVNHHPFQDSRPPDANVPAYRHASSDDQDVEARQWEDPFTAIAAARHAQRSGQPGSPTAPSDATAHDVQVLKARLSDYGHEPVLILGTMVPGAPYADDTEMRRRIRYAVLAGLSSARYVPDDNQHIGYVNLPPPETDTASKHEMAGYEWFHPDASGEASPRARVLVLWLDQDNFRTTPLRRFSNIVDVIAPPEGGASITEVILGPADSDGLRSMSSELDSGCDFLQASHRKISIYSPRATALDWWIDSDALKKRYPDTESEMNADHFNDRCEHVVLYRTVASDFSVVKSLYKELQYRGVQQASQIALITERDTFYSRLISQYFNGCEATPAPEKRFTVTADEDSSQPLCFTYLRGLDGLIPPVPDSAGSSGSDAKASTSSSTAGQAPVAPETATGKSQLDYLRRMTAEIVSWRDDPVCRWISAKLYRINLSPIERRRCEGRIKAIGIVGSDLYDKLLILQALRGAFPRYVFFTTDLDARFTDQQNLAWTREVLVGSSLGLSVRPELQGSIPPFRDSYQAATYYSAFHAVEQLIGKHAGEVINLRWTHHPRVFEIGRTQAFDLTVDKESRTPCETALNCRSIAAPAPQPLWSTGSSGTSLIVAAVAMFVALFMASAAMGDTWVAERVSPLFSRSSPQDRRRLGWAAGSLVAIALLSIWAWGALVRALTHHGDRIPPPIFGGASHWAASMVEALSILLVVTLVIRGQRKLRSNASTLLKEFRFPVPADELMESYRQWLEQPTTPRRRRYKERIWYPLRRLSGNSQDPLPTNELSPLENLIAQYLYRGRWQARLKRVLVVTLVASVVLLVLEYILMLLEFNFGISFARGFALIDTNYVERGIEDFISLLNLLAVQFLIFWVADAMLLTRSFVLALKEDRPAWPETVINERVLELGLTKEWTTFWLDLRLIAWRTGWVASLIWYPSLMIAAMAAAALTVDFGDFGFASNPIALVISAAFILGAAVMLRRVAESWRKDVLFRLDDARLAALAPSGEHQAGAAALDEARRIALEHKARLTQLDRLAERVAALREGAFAPYSEQPLVRAVLVPALTYGATAGLQFLNIGK